MAVIDWGEVAGGSLAVLLGILFIAGAIYLMVRQLQCSGRAMGTVIGSDSYENEPIVRFTAVDGAPRESGPSPGDTSAGSATRSDRPLRSASTPATPSLPASRRCAGAG